MSEAQLKRRVFFCISKVKLCLGRSEDNLGRETRELETQKSSSSSRGIGPIVVCCSGDENRTHRTADQPCLFSGWFFGLRMFPFLGVTWVHVPSGPTIYGHAGHDR